MVELESVPTHKSFLILLTQYYEEEKNTNPNLILSNKMSRKNGKNICLK